MMGDKLVSWTETPAAAAMGKDDDAPRACWYSQNSIERDPGSADSHLKNGWEFHDERPQRGNRILRPSDRSLTAVGSELDKEDQVYQDGDSQ
jgi:hypothetical protein